MTTDAENRKEPDRVEKRDIFDDIRDGLKSRPRASGGVMIVIGTAVLLYAIFEEWISGTFYMTLSLWFYGELGTRIVLALLGVITIIGGIVWFFSSATRGRV